MGLPQFDRRRHRQTVRAPEGLGLTRQPIVNGSMIALLGHAVANVAAAWLSDRVGRKPVRLAGAVLSVVSALVMFPIAATGTVAAVNTATILGFAATGILFGPMYTYFSVLFPRERRQSGVDVGYYPAGLLALSLLCLLVLPKPHRPKDVPRSATSAAGAQFLPVSNAAVASPANATSMPGTEDNVRSRAT